MLDTLEKKFYQLIISRLDGPQLSSPEYHHAMLEYVERGIGGFIVFGGEYETVKDFIDEAQRRSQLPLFIASDVERGLAQQISGTTAFPPQMAVAAAIDSSQPYEETLLEKMLVAIADEAAATGINMPLIPVLDVNLNPQNPIVNIRAFSDDPQTVSWFGEKYIDELQGKGLVCSAKHFPGHGDTSEDSHLSLPVIKKSLADLKSVDLVPFASAIWAGVESIMVGHLMFPELDDVPATISRKIITGLLRAEMGFSGLVVTDALDMDALKQFEHVPARALNAGADILLHPASVEDCVEGLKAAVETGMLEQGAVMTALSRILYVKKNLRRGVIPFRSGKVFDENREVAIAIRDKAITCLAKKEGILPLPPATPVNLVLAGDKDLREASILSEYFHDFEEADLLLVAIYTGASARRGRAGIDENEVARLKKLLARAKHSLVISFGSPYVLKDFIGEADILLAAYGSSRETEAAVCRCLSRGKEFEGTLPVTL